MEPSGMVLGRFGGRVLEVSIIDLLWPSWDDLVGASWKCSKSTFCGLPGTIWRLSHRSVQNQCFGEILGRFGGPILKELKLSLY